ncbi:uncharacterized protein K441DRAFT_695983 [Cenococcum geophilum 1.58]|uniref:uncharacterized protein n=1 Tax=Cenococcum geophilum 1.58 TaxID=794803 RepID=UPI00358FA31B|nr:hypothetical protein K441DRAFT_695983 [Cenococcum geophilum 1.58]
MSKTISPTGTNITSPTSIASPPYLPHEKSLNKATNDTASSPSYFSFCETCKEAISMPHPTIWCLICSSANEPSVIRSLCLTCYATGASRTSHSHNLSFYASNSDSILPDSQLPQQKWVVRRNSSKRLWYEHRQTGYKTYMQPMTAICKLPAGWQLKKDPEGKIYYENALTGQLSRTIPAGLPAGWREAKDPDGKSFFVHDGLQLSSWYRPGEQPPVRRPDGGRQTTTPISAGPTSTALIRPSGSGPVARPAQIAAKANLVTIKPRGSTPTAGAAPPSASQVTIQTAAEATINLIDPSEGGIVRNTKIAAHIAGQGVRSTVKAMKHNKRLQNFAKGTGIAVANRQVKRTWRKAAREVSGRDRQEVTIRQGGPQGQELILEEVDEGYDGEYVVEYDDGTVEYYGADCQEEPPQRTWQEQQAWEQSERQRKERDLVVHLS